MHPALTQTQADRRRSDASGEDQQHTGKIISISIPFWDLDLIEEMDLQARMECCSSKVALPAPPYPQRQSRAHQGTASARRVGSDLGEK